MLEVDHEARLTPAQHLRDEIAQAAAVLDAGSAIDPHHDRIGVRIDKKDRLADSIWHWEGPKKRAKRSIGLDLAASYASGDSSFLAKQ
ncbi:MAG: hypothetical protein Q7S40_32110 [Opitutaceae bacterium]|nr:hypothetical protein [Opitutaceae bacterium]